MLEPNLTEPSALDLARKWLPRKARSPLLEYVPLRVRRSFEPVSILTTTETLTKPGLHILYRRLQ